MYPPPRWQAAAAAMEMFRRDRAASQEMAQGDSSPALTPFKLPVYSVPRAANEAHLPAEEGGEGEGEEGGKRDGEGEAREKDKYYTSGEACRLLETPPCAAERMPTRVMVRPQWRGAGRTRGQ